MQGKISEELCEDDYYISENFIAVIDGVTPKSDFLYQGKTTGKIAAEMVKSILKGLPKDIEVDDFINEVNVAINDFYKNVCFPYSKEEKGVQAACVVYSGYRREIWMIGDCQVIIDGQIFENPKPTDGILSEMRSMVLHILQAENGRRQQLEDNQQIARTIIEPWILKANIFANNEAVEYGYSIVNGEKIPKSLIKLIRLDGTSHEVIFASDGYPKVKDTLQESEAYLKEILEADQACYLLYKSTKGVMNGYKSFDDRTYVKFFVEEI